MKFENDFTITWVPTWFDIVFSFLHLNFIVSKISHIVQT